MAELEPRSFTVVRMQTDPGGPEVPPNARWHDDIREAIAGLPRGDQVLRGVPFALEPRHDTGGPLWIGPGRAPVTLPLPGCADHRRILIAHASLPSPEGRLTTGAPSLTTVLPGEPLARYVVEFTDGTQTSHAVRRRFEVGDLICNWGEAAFAAVPHQMPRARNWHGPSDEGAWGWDQTAVEPPLFMSGPALAGLPARITPTYWLWSIPIAEGHGQPARIRLEPVGDCVLLIGGLTLSTLTDNPFRWGRRRAFKVSADGAVDLDYVTVDLGWISTSTTLARTDHSGWLDEPARGLGSPPKSSTEPLDRLIEVVASDDAQLTIGGTSVALSELDAAANWDRADGRLRIEPLAEPDIPVRVTVHDGATGQPTPSRIHIRAADGRYIAPRGHRREINTYWFQDYGADLQLGSTPYAYVDGRFEVVLPRGEVYIEVVKGFEYEPSRLQISIDGTSSDLEIDLGRAVDWRRNGWVTADTHVHFLSPDTAHLEAQAEGVNIVNLLAAQWGEMYTNVGDYTGRAAGASSAETIVWVGSENRQHMLGHINLLGMTGSPVWPLSAAGPSESTPGDPTWTNLSDWADACRARDGVVVSPHFPNPFSEIVADIITGRIDGVELREFGHGIESPSLREWYRLLNLGYRVAAVGGTDKMDAAMPIGGVRTYADIGTAELTFPVWAEAVRHGRTFTTSGPLIDVSVAGQRPGATVVVPPSGAVLDVRVEVESIYPIDAIEIVRNGEIVERSTPTAAGHSVLEARVRVDRTGWIAARCVGPAIAWHGWPVRTAAHTSPVYISGPRVERDPADVKFLTAVLDGGMTWLNELALVPDGDAVERLRRVFEEAKRQLHASDGEGA